MVLFLSSWLLAYYAIPAEYYEYLLSIEYFYIILWKYTNVQRHIS